MSVPVPMSVPMSAAGLKGPVAIAGAGSIGCFIGAVLAAAGHKVILLGRPRVLDAIRKTGLVASDFAGFSCTIQAEALTLSHDPSCLSEAAMVLVTVKSGSTAAIAQDIARHAPVAAPVISLQNGLDNAATLRAALPQRDVRAAMVPFNVVPNGKNGSAAWHRATSGDIVIQSGPGDLASFLGAPGLDVVESNDIVAVQWGKLLLNLNNAINALSGLTLLEQLKSRDWRRLMADQMAEALAVLKAAQIPVTSTTPLPAWMGPHVLRLPTPLFARVAAQMLTIDPMARTSMAYDLAAGRKTEIDSLQGEILTLAARHGMIAPLAQQISNQIALATDTGVTAPRLQPADLRPPQRRYVSP